MRVLIAGQHHHVRAGSDRYQMELGRALRTRGIEVIPFAAKHANNEASPWSPYFPERVDQTRATIRGVPRFVYSGVARRQMAALLDAARPDVAHLHIYYGQLTGSILPELRRRGIPVVQTLHEYKLLCPVYTCVSHDEVCERCGGRAFWNAAVHRCNRGSVARSCLSALEATVSRGLGDNRLDHYISPSRFLKERLIQHGVVRDEEVSVQPYFVDLERFKACGSLGNRLVYFGRLAPVKGLRTLLDAVAPLKHVALTIVGRGELKDAIAERIEREGLSHINLIPHLDEEDLRTLLSQAFATVLPSEWYENYPLAIMESMALGRAVIATRVGGIPEMVADGEDGILVEPRQTEALRAAIEFIARNREAATRMGQAARKKAEALWAPAPHCEKIVQIYRDVRQPRRDG